MLFTSLIFWLFFTIFLIFYFFAKGKLRLWICLIGSYFFYGWWDWRFLGLIILLTAINYVAGQGINKENATPRLKKTALSCSIIASLTILIVFKYLNFFSQSFFDLLKLAGITSNYPTISFILPIGISFYTFKALSYPIDLYRNQKIFESSLLRFSVFVAFFPQLLAGPIQRASTFLPQLKHDYTFNYDDLMQGLYLIIWGFVLKSVLADSLAPVVDDLFLHPFNYNPLPLLIGILFYSFQIYGDFAGYSLIAIGVSRILGFSCPTNFDRPYFSTNFREFWQRWHISLSSWLRDYVYIPLGGNRKGNLRTGINLMFTMFLCGLWHGASWNFIAWGGLHGFYLLGQRLFKALPLSYRSYGLIQTVQQFCSVLICFILTSIAWVFFRSQNLEISMYILTKLSQFRDYSFSVIPHPFHVIKGVFLIGFVFTVELLSFKYNMKEIIYHNPFWGAVFVIAALLLIALFGTFANNAFIYLQF